MEFTPNVSACSLSSDGGTAKILWGFRNGDVAIMTASKAMDLGGGVNGRSAAKLVRNKVDDQHEGNVTDVAWDEGKSFFVSGGADGKVKLWDAKKVECVWTSERQIGTLIKDPCARVASVLAKGVIVGAMQSGEIVLWTGFKLESLLSEENSSATFIRDIRIPSAVLASPNDQDGPAIPDISSLYIDTSATSTLTLLASYIDHPYFYRLRVDLESGLVDHAVFGDNIFFGRIHSLKPFFSSRTTDSNFVITGDSLGCVSVYEWDVNPPFPHFTPILPARKFEAYEDASSITALAWNGVTLMTGSDHAIVRVWDGLTFEHLKSFSSPIPKTRVRAMAIHQPLAQVQREFVNQILISPEGEVVMASVGDTIMAWRAGPVSKSTGGMRKVNAAGKKNRDQTAAAKYFSKCDTTFLFLYPSKLDDASAEQLEFHQTISESRKALEQEHEHVQKVFGREREQRQRLEKLGLDEVEAVSYVLMLSRDEEMQRLAAITNQSANGASGSGNGRGNMAVEEGVFQGDFDDVDYEVTPDGSASTSSMTGRYHSSNSHTYEATSQPFITASYHRASTSPPQNQPLGRPIPRVSPSMSNAKIQVSPRFRPEPVEAGSIQESRSTLELPEPALSLAEDESHFPPISTSTSPVTLDGLSISRSPSRSASGSGVRPPTSGGSSPQSIRSTSKSTSAWGISHSRSEGPSPGSSFASRASWAITPPRINDRLPASPGLRTGGALDDDEMDEDLRFAIELSLVEARSRGEDV